MGVRVGTPGGPPGVEAGICVLVGVGVDGKVREGVSVGIGGSSESIGSKVAVGVAVGCGVTRCAATRMPSNLAKSCSRN
jgi:hypothetical protein